MPLLLVIDPCKSLACLFSEPADRGYRRRVEVGLGAPLGSPHPWEITLDTGALICA